MFTKRLRITALVVALLIGALVGAAMVQPDAEAAGTRRMTVPAGAFAPTTDNWDYDNAGYYLETNSGSAFYTAPLFFPKDKVRINRVIMRAYDNGPGEVCLELVRAQPGAVARFRCIFQPTGIVLNSTTTTRINASHATEAMWPSSARYTRGGTVFGPWTSRCRGVGGLATAGGCGGGLGGAGGGGGCGGSLRGASTASVPVAVSGGSTSPGSTSTSARRSTRCSPTSRR